MSNIIRIRRRTSGSAGAPSSLENAELAFNEVGEVLYYGQGTGGAGGTATSIIPIAGSGAFMDLSSNQTVGGTKTFSNAISGSVTGNAGTATALATSRNIALTDDVTGTASFNGTADANISATLKTVNSNIGTYTKVTINAKGLATAGATASLSDLSVPTGNIPFATYKITGLGDPTADQDAATKFYVDSVAQGLNVKQAVIASTTGNITLSGLSTQAGGDWGSSLTAGDRVLVKNQGSSQFNGIYVASASTWARASDANTWNELISAFTFIQTGTTLADTGWVCTIDAGGTLDVTPMPWAQFSGAGTYTAGTGLTLTGNQFSITNTAVTGASYGNANGTQTPTFTVNAQGQLTAAATVTINVDGGTF